MDTADFDFELPNELIAQNPVVPRDSSRMLHLQRSTESIKHKHFYDLSKCLQEGDVLVINDTKVVPPRLFGTIPESVAKHTNRTVILVKHYQPVDSLLGRIMD